MVSPLKVKWKVRSRSIKQNHEACIQNAKHDKLVFPLNSSTQTKAHESQIQTYLLETCSLSSLLLQSFGGCAECFLLGLSVCPHNALNTQWLCLCSLSHYVSVSEEIYWLFSANGKRAALHLAGKAPPTSGISSSSSDSQQNRLKEWVNKASTQSGNPTGFLEVSKSPRLHVLLIFHPKIKRENSLRQ